MHGVKHACMHALAAHMQLLQLVRRGRVVLQVERRLHVAPQPLRVARRHHHGRRREALQRARGDVEGHAADVVQVAVRDEQRGHVDGALRAAADVERDLEARQDDARLLRGRTPSHP